MVLVTALLLLANGFFVGAEFAAMAARRSQLEPLAAEGSRRAQRSLEALEQMGSVLAAAQLGITVCSVLLGAFSEAALHHALVPVGRAVRLARRGGRRRRRSFSPCSSSPTSTSSSAR